MLEHANWISSPDPIDCPEFLRSFAGTDTVRATLRITSLGVYSARINGGRVGTFCLAPGWTVYRSRVQVQEYDVTDLIRDGENLLSVTLAGGWYRGKIAGKRNPEDPRPALIAELTLTFGDGTNETLTTDASWRVRECATRSADIYLGEVYDATFAPGEGVPAVVRDLPRSVLIPQQGEEIVAGEELFPARLLKTPRGETVIDFGQEITGVVRMTVRAKRGTEIVLRCAEMLDADGNFYLENYRGATSEMKYICRGGEKETWQPEFTFYGFRYIRVEGILPEAGDFCAVVLSSGLRRVGWLKSGSALLNRLFENIVWGQKGNFLDVPTDCPQRDERMGWTGDAQVFANTACWQFEVKRFFTKWLTDMMTDQRDNGAIPDIVPDMWEITERQEIHSSAAWGDAATVCPWMVYRHYGDAELLRTHYDMMKKWVGFVGGHTVVPNLWVGYPHPRKHYGDWLGLDAEKGSYVGATDPDFIASAFYYHSTCLVVEAGRALGEDVSAYEALAGAIRSAFAERFPICRTQTECVLALHFGLTDDREAVTRLLVSLIRERGTALSTGFVGTPYLLFALSENGQTELAYSLLLREEFPSWLYSVRQGATTVWEHWDGKAEDGSFWNKDMNSFNHYAYGSVASWVYEYAAGITPLEPGFSRIRIEPHPDARLGWLSARHDTAYGTISVAWYCEDGRVRYEIATPVPAEIVIDGRIRCVKAGSYLF